MFDERHLQLSAAYAKNSEYFIKTAIYPLVNFLCEKIVQRIREELDNKLKLEVGEETYVMTPDEDGGWKWEKYDEKNNEFVPTSDEVKEELNELVSETLAEQVSSNTAESTSNINGKLDGLDKAILKAIHQALSESTPTTTSESSLESAPEIEAESNLGATGETATKSVETPPETESSPSSIESTVTESTATNETVEPNAVLNSTVVSPPHYDASETLLEPEHWREIVEGSEIAPEIAASNFRSLSGDAAWDYLLYSEKLERTNTGRLSTGTLKTYSHIEGGGWWCDGGVDPRSFANLQSGEVPDRKDWGCFKPNVSRPKKDDKGQIIEGKFIKYEHPPSVGTSIFLLDVPANIAERIYNKAGVNPSESDRASGFWYCVWKHNVPVIITEGAKKTASLLSQGHAAIGVPGINNGYRARDEKGDSLPTHVLQDELAVFATPGREVKICFDYESKRKTRRNIDIATYRTGQLFEDAGSKVSVIQLPGPDKGVDDFIVAKGARAFEELLHQKAQPLQDWHQNHQQPDLRLTVFLKNGQEIKLYEQKGDGTVNVVSQEEVEEQIFGNTPRKKPVAQESESEADFTPPTATGLPTFSPPPELSPLPQINTDFDKVVADYHQQNQQEALTPKASIHPPPPQPQQTKSWARQQRVTLYQQTEPRKQLEELENGKMALAAFHLVKNYGVRQESKDDEKEVSIYHADAFAIKKNGNDYTIFRRSDKKVLMTFEADQSATPTIRVTQKPQEMLSVERQEFLLVFDCIGKDFPSPDQDPRKIANALGSLSPKGTHAILESFKQKEVFEVLAQTLSKFERDDLTLGNYRILYQKSQHDSSSYLQLLKTDNNGTTRVAASFDINKTQSGMTYQVKTLAVNEQDLNKLKLLAQKLDIPQKATTVNPYATSNTEVAVHPAIAKYIDRLETPEQTQTPQSNKSNGETFPVHPELKKNWQAIEHNDRWLPVDYNGRSILPFAFLSSGNLTRAKINNNQGLTISEQRELYFAIHTQAHAEILAYGKTDITLSSWDEILKDLTRHPIKEAATATAQPQTQNTVNATERSLNSRTVTTTTEPQQNSKTITTIERPIKRQTQSQTIKSDSLSLPIHPELARNWQEIENNKGWSPVAQGVSDKVRDKIQSNQGLTISEQCDLYFAIRIQAQTEILAHKKTEITLPVWDDILQDLTKQSTLDGENLVTTERPIKRQTQSQTIKSGSPTLPIHPELSRNWQEIENNKRWQPITQQVSNEFRDKIQSNQGLTFSEQHELYFVIQVQAQAEIRANGQTDIVLSPLNEIIKDLRQQSPLNNPNNESDRDTQLPLHPELAKHWQDLEVNKKWTGVANQWNYPLRQKLKETGKLTIGEQRELYQKLVVQREVELNRNQKSDISLPPFSQILDDLRGEREKAINNTYSPKVEVVKPQQHSNIKPKSNEVEL